LYEKRPLMQDLFQGIAEARNAADATVPRASETCSAGSVPSPEPRTPWEDMVRCGREVERREVERRVLALGALGGVAISKTDGWWRASAMRS
jgi:hypothetical protein